MSVMMVRSRVKAESQADVEAGVRKMFAAIERREVFATRLAGWRTASRTSRY